MVRETHKFKVSVSDQNYYVVEIKDNCEFEIEDLKQLVAFEKEISGKVMPVLVICAFNAQTNNELITYLSKNVNNPYCKAEAFIITSLAQKILANVYLKFTTPERPVKFFKKKEEGIKWLEKYIE